MKFVSSFLLIAHAMRLGFARQAMQIGGLLGSGFACTLFVYLFSRVWLSRLGPDAHEAATRACWYTLIGEVGLFSFGRSQLLLLKDSLRQGAAYQMMLPQRWLFVKLAELWGAGLFLSCGLALTPCLLLLVSVGSPSDLKAMEIVTFVVAYAIAGALRCLMVMLISCLSFWIDRTDAIFWLYSQLSLLAGVLMPLTFYPETIQKYAWYTPFPMLVHVPASLLLYRESTNLSGWHGCVAVVVQLLWCAALCLAAHALYLAGTRRYFEKEN